MRNHLITGENAGTIPAHPAINTGNKSTHSCKAPTPPYPTPLPLQHPAEGQPAREEVAPRGWGDCFKSEMLRLLRLKGTREHRGSCVLH